ncbi:MAG: hypothetical protein F4213_03405 [Boseongicola sp. SB0677_bin_26]|nr:hypothetical protein [Boseongicola sp. SB0665_bin_10]MYG25061.1 hypothetical protein [Boseongicola sp. SB0677_bin_26]
MIEPLYWVEMTPIRDTKETSGWHTACPISGRVLEAYRGTHIGQFSLGANGKPHIAVFIKGGTSGKEIDCNRLDPAIHLIWKEYYDSLPLKEKLYRRLFAHRAWIAALIVSVIASSIVLTVDRTLVTGATLPEQLEFSDDVDDG